MEKVIVTPRSLSKEGHPLLDRIREAGYEILFPSPGTQPTADQLADCIGEASGYLAGVEKIDAALLGAATHLRVISRNGTAIDNIDIEKAKAMGIVVRKAEGANARGVAELTFGHILSAARGIPFASAELKAGRWTRKKGFELEGKTLGVVGCGKIGKLVSYFALAFGMKVLACDPYPDAGFRPSPLFAYATLATVLADSDIVSLHCPPREDGKPVLGPETLALMRRGALLVNTARESLVDKVALLAALDSGALAVYTVDAFDAEPPEDEEIQRHPAVIATPHIGGFTNESIDRAAEAAIDNLLEELAT